VKIDSIVITGIYLLIWTVIVAVLWPLKLLIEGVSLANWYQEFRFLFEIIFLGWSTLLSLTILFRLIRYSSAKRFAGSIVFGVATSVALFVFITLSDQVFDGRFLDLITRVSAENSVLYVYISFFVLGLVSYFSLYKHT